MGELASLRLRGDVALARAAAGEAVAAEGDERAAETTKGAEARPDLRPPLMPPPEPPPAEKSSLLSSSSYVRAMAEPESDDEDEEPTGARAGSTGEGGGGVPRAAEVAEALAAAARSMTATSPGLRDPPGRPSSSAAGGREL